jgi:hypothetical protein
MPWLYTSFMIIIHLPSVLIRATRWQMVQTLSIGLAAVNIVVFTQAYHSTQLAPEKVMVWTPIMLLLDAGAMLQLFVMVVEANGSRLPVLRRFINSQSTQSNQFWNPFLPCFRPQSTIRKCNPSLVLSSYIDHLSDTDEDTEEGMGMQHLQLLLTATSSQQENEQQSVGSVLTLRHQQIRQRNADTAMAQKPDEAYPQSNPLQEFPVFASFLIVASFVLFFAAVALQIRGLVAAVHGQQSKDLQATWCSPIFQPFGLTVLDGNCIFHPVVLSPGKGVGCIDIPATQQKNWLSATVVVTSISLVIETVDLFILVFVNSKFKLSKDIKMKRPWGTMFTGILVLVITAAFGAIQASNLPSGITRQVWVVMDEPNPFVCNGTITPAGLRGAIIGWTDGLLESMGTAYFGSLE